MPYNRYDLKNKYNYRGKRVNERIGLKILFLVLIPIFALLIIALGVLIAYRVEMGPIFKDPQPTTVDQIQIVSDDELLRVVNSHNHIEADYAPELVSYGDVQVSAVIYDDLSALMNAAEKDGINLSVTAGFVSYEDQQVLYEETFKKIKEESDYSVIRAESETRKVCPQAGSSESQTGLLVKFSTSESKKGFEKSEAARWLENNAVNYGFVLRYPEGEEVLTGMNYAPDTYRYVGKEHALNMRRFDMTLEEYSAHVSER